MSFYGNVFYEFAELFRHFKFSNSGYDKTNLLTTKPADAEAKATERWDILNMDSGNRWIILQGDNDGVDFYHAKSGTSDSEYATDLIQNFSANGANATGATTLSCGSTFTMPQLHFDSAGHFTSDAAITRKYKLPTAASIYNDGAPAYSGQKEATGLAVDLTATGATSLKEGDTIVTNTISLTDKGTVSTVTQKAYKMPITPEPFNSEQVSNGFVKIATTPNEATALKAGEYFSTDQITVNKKGAITDITKRYYKLPISEEAVQLDAIEDRVETIEQNWLTLPDNFASKQSVEDLSKDIEGLLAEGELETILKDYVKSGTHEALEQVVSNLSQNLQENYYTTTDVDKIHNTITETLDTIDDVYAKIEDVGVVADVYEKETAVQEKFTTITAAIGNLEQSNQTIYPDEKTAVHSVAEQLTSVAKTVGDIDGLYSKNTQILDEDKFQSIAKAIGNLETSSNAVDPESEEVLTISAQLTKVNALATTAANSAWSITQNLRQIYEPFFELQDLVQNTLQPKIVELENTIKDLQQRIEQLENKTE